MAPRVMDDSERNGWVKVQSDDDLPSLKRDGTGPIRRFSTKERKKY